MPFPICTRHALQVSLAIQDETLRLMARQGYLTPGSDEEIARIAAGPDRSGQAQVYYLNMPGGVIKIGTTTNMTERLTGLRVGREAVLATEPGNKTLERIRHKQFAHLRIGRREDFRPEPELLAWIERRKEKCGPPVITSYKPVRLSP
jgi:hypothetical protein